ncbi:MAG: helicase associated domain-containing protein [Magnetococcales bacterium]|nr:helicase associated domain-containing protein [Magnetococcales bacterium]
MLPRHPKAKYFLETGLFQEITRFVDLETRIRALPTPEEQQAAFGLFAEGILTTRALHRAVEIWPAGEIPLEARRRLSLPERIPGADGVFRSLEGEIHAYQLCFRPDRPIPLPDEPERLLPFAANAPRPLLITNGDRVDHLGKAKQAHALRGADLDRLEARHFQALRRWLQGAGSAIERPLPVASHAWAMEQLHEGLTRSDQAELHLAPGAEAALLALRLALRLGGRRLVVVIATDLEQLIHLVRQWRHHLGWGDLAVLQVTEEPGSTWHPLELDFPLTHQVDGIRRFLAWSHTGGRVILATRAALGVVARAMIGTPRADLAIGFDTLAEPIAAAKRIRLTAPSLPRPAETESSVVAPLARPWRLVLLPLDTAEPTLGDLTARLEGMERCDHLFALSTDLNRPFDPPSTWNLLTLPEERGYLIREPVLTSFSQANRAILHLMPAQLGRHLPVADGALVLVALNPTQLTALLEPLLAASRAETPALLILPLVLDGAGIGANPLLWELLKGLLAWDPTLGSQLRAAMEQLGRTGTCDPEPFLTRMRILPGPAGTVDGEMLVEALLRTLGDPQERRYGELIHFCRLHGHGAVPAHLPQTPELAAWAVRMRQAHGRGQLDPEWRARLDKLGFVWDLEAHAWAEELNRLKRFIARTGHAIVPSPCPEDPELSEWAERQRLARKRAKISGERQAELERLGFVWDLEAHAWEADLLRFKRFIEQHGHARIPDPCPEEPELSDWAERVRLLAKKSRLQPDRHAELEALGFVWDPARLIWDERFAALEDFLTRFGHFDPTRDLPDDPELPAWIKGVRAAHEKGRLEADKRARLEGIGFVWDGRQAAWEARFLALTRFRAARNHCLVPARWETDPDLARWVEQQRRDYRANQLNPEQIARLEALGFLWDSKAIFWEEMYAALTDYRAHHGDCLVPEGAAELSQLAWWVAAQRKARLSGQLEAERVARLEAIGFVWDAQEVIWLESFRGLEGFKERFGHLLVPGDWPENPRLAAWVTAQRNARLKGHLAPEHAERLSALGMIWDPKEAVAEEMMQQLRDFKRRHGHCEVPLDSPDHPRLGMWLQFQRQAKKDGQLDPERTRKLAEIGVIWR